MASDGYAEVEAREAGQSPYPVVYVNEDGSYRECTPSEREYLEERFHPADGARPYVKDSYRQRTPDGRLSGFMRRAGLPLNARFAR